jgi:hypothetical protein
MDDEMELYLGVARDIVVKRTIERNERKRVSGNLYDHEMVVKYEIENFKDSPVTLDIREQASKLREELGLSSGRGVQWRLGKETTIPGGLDYKKSDAEKLLFHVELPSQKKRGEKQVFKLHFIAQNEWR